MPALSNYDRVKRFRAAIKEANLKQDDVVLAPEHSTIIKQIAKALYEDAGYSFDSSIKPRGTMLSDDDLSNIVSIIKKETVNK